MKRLLAVLLAGALSLWSFAAQAQNAVCPTMPLGDSTNACASTAFVQANALSAVLPSGDLYVGNASNVATAQALSGDCTISNAGAITCTKTSGTSFAPSATTDTTNAANISSGTLPAGRMPALTGDVTSSAGSTATTLAWISRAASKTETFNNSLTFAGVDGKTETFNNSLTFAGTDSTTMTFPASNGTIAALNIQDQTLTGGANVTSLSLGTISSGTTTLDCGARPTQFLTNNGAFTLAAPGNDGSCIILVTNGASAGTISFSGFTVGSNTGDTYATTNTNKYDLFVRCINSVCAYQWSAHQ